MARENLYNKSGRTCTSCRVFKLWVEFHKTRSGTAGYLSSCIKCFSKKSKENKQLRKQRDPERFYQTTLKTNLRQQYKLTLEDYNKLLNQQNSVCAICKSPSPGRKGNRSFQVDHNHKTGQIRGLLCHPCNVHLGILENITWCEKAFLYLKSYRSGGD